MAVAGWILDKSAAARSNDARVSAQLIELAGSLYICPVGILEQLYSARSAKHYDPLEHIDMHVSRAALSRRDTSASTTGTRTDARCCRVAPCRRTRARTARILAAIGGALARDDEALRDRVDGLARARSLERSMCADTPSRKARDRRWAAFLWSGGALNRCSSHVSPRSSLTLRAVLGPLGCTSPRRC